MDLNTVVNTVVSTVGHGELFLIGVFVVILGALSKKMRFKLPVIGQHPPVAYAIGGAIMLVSGLAFVGFFNSNGNLMTVQNGFQNQGNAALNAVNGVIPSVSANCPDTKNTVLNIAEYDDYSATPGTMIAGTSLYVKDETTGKVYTSSTSSTSRVAITMTGQCGNGHVYRIYGVSNASAIAGCESQAFQLTEGSTDIDLHTNQLTYATVKVKDNSESTGSSGYAYCLTDAVTGGGTNATTGVDLNETFCTSSIAGADYTVGADGNLNLGVYVASATARKFLNEKGFIGDGAAKTSLGNKLIACVDLNYAQTASTAWDTNTLQVNWNSGTSLNNLKAIPGGLDVDTARYAYVQNSEACYAIPGDVDNADYYKLGLKVTALSGVNPGTNNADIRVCFLSEGLYKSSIVNDKFAIGAYNDASSQSATAYTAAYVPCVNIPVA